MGSICSKDHTESVFSSNLINVLVIGDVNVGKDTLMEALKNQGESVGPEADQKFKYKKKLIRLKRLKKSEPEFFQMSTPQCLQQADVILLCVDLSKTSTLQSFSDSFFEKIIQHVRDLNLRLRVLIVGCKVDKTVRNKTQEEELEKKTSEIGLPFFKVSSINKTNIVAVLNALLDHTVKNLSPESVEEQVSILSKSKYVDVQSSLRDGGGSAFSAHPSKRDQIKLASLPQVNDQKNNFQIEVSKATYQEEESKMESNSNVQQQSLQFRQYQQNPYIRIIPHEKMYSNKRMALDKGNFGTVYKIDFEGEQCALKICKIEMSEETALNRFQIIFSEAENMQRFMLIRNMRIMPLKGISFQVDMQRGNVLIGYWMPLCKYSLKHLLKTQFQNITFVSKIRWSLQIIECLEVFFHEHIQHMDLKPQNILLDQNDDIVVSDLSMSKVFEQKHTSAFNMLGTTAKYAHPAAIINHELSPRFDIYSFGVILLELFTGKQPWGNTRREDLKDIYTQVLNQPELMNPLTYHQENYPQEMKYIQGPYQPIKDIIYLCCVAIFISDKKDFVTIEHIKLKFKELADSAALTEELSQH